MDRPADFWERLGREQVEALPGSVKVGPFDFRIEKWNGVSATSAHRYGECSTVELAIRISLAVGHPLKAVDTFWHEVFHALYWVMGIDDKDDEERVVRGFSTGLSGIFRDNPWVSGWVDRGVRAAGGEA